MKYSDFLRLCAVMLLAPKVEHGYVAMAIVLAVAAILIEFIDRGK